MPNQPTAITNRSIQEPALPTFMDHLQELKSRFFWIAIFFVVASSIAYPYFQRIVDLLVLPLGSEKLYYTTVAGGLSFIIKICMYVGIVAILPVVIYHLYKFIAPVMQKNNAKAVLGYTIMSSILAASGILFAYFVSLPAALHFLTSINLNHIDSLLTLDSYLSFVTAYIVAGALLFQLPLILLIINSITPLPPRKLMSYQRHTIVGAFVLAAILSPTPDVVNQSLMAAPIIIMYQIGIVLVWLRQRSQRRRAARTVRLASRTAPAKRSVKQPIAAMSSSYRRAVVSQLASSSHVAVPQGAPVLPVLSPQDIRPKRSPLVTPRRPVVSRGGPVIEKRPVTPQPSMMAQLPPSHQVVSARRLSTRPTVLRPAPSVRRGLDGFAAPRAVLQ